MVTSETVRVPAEDVLHIYRPIDAGQIRGLPHVAPAMVRLFPRARWLWYLLAIGCALTRVLAVAHFLSDTVVAAVLGWVVGQLLSAWMLARRAAIMGTPS